MNLGFLPLLIKLSWRSIWSHRIKSLVVGCIIFIGVFLLVLSDAMMSSVNLAMERSLTYSITGHLQLFDSKARDKLSMLGMAGNLGADPNVGRIENFAEVKAVIEQHANVQQVVPMGTDYALVFRGNVVDEVVDSLRAAEKGGDSFGLDVAKRKIVDITKSLTEQYQYTIAISRDREKAEQDLAHLQRVSSDQFWDEYEQDTERSTLFLETKIAPLVKSRDPMFLQFMATDIDRFQKAFPYFAMVLGEPIPEGARGLLINHEQYEYAFKDRMARLLDYINNELTVKENGPLATNDDIKSKIKRRQVEAHDWILSQDSEKLDEMHNVLSIYLKDEVEKLQQSITLKDSLDLKEALNKQETIELAALQELRILKVLDSPEELRELKGLLKVLLDVNDENFFERYEFFQTKMEPLIDLYPIDIGDMLTLNKFGDGTSIRVKFFGTYTFEGLQHSGFSGFYNLMDLTSFREMHGFSSLDQLEEMEMIKKDSGSHMVSADSVIDDLFGEDSSLEITEEFSGSSAFEALEEIKVINIQERMQMLAAERYTQDELENGPVLSASVVLKDRSKIKKTTKELEKLIEENELQIQMIDWQQAAGFVGQMITVMQVILYTFIAFVFCVATVIINNAMFMSTMQRFTEIGTLRAIGASQSIIMGMFLFESIILAAIAGLLGLLLAFACILYLGDAGILAPKPEVHFLFGGERLYPHIGWENVYLGLIVVFVVSVGATLYPAIYATRIPPLVAMTARE